MANRVPETTALSAETSKALRALADRLGMKPSTYIRSLIEKDLAERGEASPEPPSGRRLSVAFQFGPEAADFLRENSSKTGADRNDLAKRYALQGMRAAGLVDDLAAVALAEAGNEARSGANWEDEL